MKLGTLVLSEKEVEEIYRSKKYICTYSKVYHITYSVNAGYGYLTYLQPSNCRISKKGYFHTLTGDEINNILGYSWLNNL